MKPTLIKTSKGLINLNNVITIEKVNGQGSMKWGIRFGFIQNVSALYESYDTEFERDTAYENIFEAFGVKIGEEI